MEKITAKQITNNIENLAKAGKLKYHEIDGKLFVEASSIACNIDKFTASPKTKKMGKKAFLAHEIDNYDVSIRTLNVLHAMGVRTIADTLPLHNSDFLKVHRQGRRCWEELDEFLAMHGMTRDAYKPIEYFNIF